MAILRNNHWPVRAIRALLLAGLFLLAAGIGYSQAVNSCIDCHSAMSDNLGVTQEKFSQDIHSQKGLTCVSCHGGDASSYDPTQAMGHAAGFKGKFNRKQIPALCGSCHSNPNLMRTYNPSLRTDQLDQYHTSVHGKRLAAGDDKVAVCIDCHSVHDIRPPSDPRSTVNPVNVAKTCSRCHSDAAYMKPYGIPTDQFANYSTSVHHDALAVRGDLSAPTCTTCHGNHGATPPGVDKVQNVCANCHVFQAQMYAKSTHSKVFQDKGLPGCVVCHTNHGIHMPSDAMLDSGQSGVCMRCHTVGDHCDRARAVILSDLNRLDRSITEADSSLRLAESAGMEVSEARLNQDQARDALTKARVTIHSFQPDLVEQDIQTGMKIAVANRKAGENAMVERNRRRMGLGVCLIAIGSILVGLRLYIQQIES
jgi:predicted CXXCH cytochrome family protein